MCSRTQCGSFFSNWNISTIVFFISKYIETVVCFSLAAFFDLVEFGFG